MVSLSQETEQLQSLNSVFEPIWDFFLLRSAVCSHLPLCSDIVVVLLLENCTIIPNFFYISDV